MAMLNNQRVGKIWETYGQIEDNLGIPWEHVWQKTGTGKLLILQSVQLTDMVENRLLIWDILRYPKIGECKKPAKISTQWGCVVIS